MIYGKPGSLSNLSHPLVRGSLLSIKHLHVTLLHVSQFNGILGLIQFAKKKKKSPDCAQKAALENPSSKRGR